MMIWRFVLKIFVILVLTSDIYLALSDDSSEKPKHEESDLLAPWKKRVRLLIPKTTEICDECDLTP